MMEVPADDTPNTPPGPTVADSGRARAGKGLTRWFTPDRKVVTIEIIILVAGFLIYVIASRGAKGAVLTKGTQPDASVFISTLILIYTVFLAVYGALLPMLISKEHERGAREWLAIVLIALAIILNFVRIQNSLGDLYTTTMLQLTPDKIRDASYEFMHYYFIINVVVIAIALGVISRRPRNTANGKHPGSDRPQTTDPQ
jgi:hypothetical protein